MRRHGFHHVGGFGLPVVADITHRQEDFMLFIGGIGSAERQGSGDCSRAHASSPVCNFLHDVILPRSRLVSQTDFCGAVSLIGALRS
jgi:hypothetical protein